MEEEDEDEDEEDNEEPIEKSPVKKVSWLLDSKIFTPTTNV